MGYFRNRTPISTDDPYNDQKIMKISRSNRRAEKDTQYFPTYSEVRIKHVRSKIWTLRGNLMIHLTILRELIFFQVSIPFPQVHTICCYVCTYALHNSLFIICPVQCIWIGHPISCLWIGCQIQDDANNST